MGIVNIDGLPGILTGQGTYLLEGSIGVAGFLGVQLEPDIYCNITRITTKRNKGWLKAER